MSLKVHANPASLGDTAYDSLGPTVRQGASRTSFRPQSVPSNGTHAEAHDLCDEVRRLRILLQRNPEQDGENARVRYEGYRACWPDGQEVSVGVQRFCQHGCRLLLGRKVRQGDEHLVELGVHPVGGLEAPLTQLEHGMRCRRFYLEQVEGRARMFFFNGSPTDVEFDVEHDEPLVIRWLGLDQSKDGERLWFDLSARSMVSAAN